MSQSSNSVSAKSNFTTAKPETIFSREHMLEVDIQGIDGSIYAVNANGQWKYFCTNLVKIMYSTGPRENPFEKVVAKSALSGLPDAYTNTDFGFEEDHRWGDGPTVANAYFDEERGNIIAFMHTEWTLQSKDGTYFRMGIAVSKDGGKSFEWCGHFLEPELTYDTWNNHWRGRAVGGHHNMANIGLANIAIKDGYFYLYYADAKNEPDAFIQGTAVVRTKVADLLEAADRLEVSTWHKYYEGEWNEPSRGGGRFTALNIDPLGYLHGDASYNTYLDKFVLITRHGKHTGPDGKPMMTGSILISFSDDGINWEDWQTVHADNHLHDYPSIMSTGDHNNETGKSFWVCYKYCFNDVLPKWDWYTNHWDRVLVTMQ